MRIPCGCRVMMRLISACLCVGRKYELYSMDWDLKEELRDCLVAAAPYGGPIGKSPLCHCMLKDHGMNSGSLFPGGLAVEGFLLACATHPHPTLLRCFNCGSREACHMWCGPSELVHRPAWHGVGLGN